MLRRSQFADREDAGRQLADELGEYKDRDDVVVLALPRGGVPVGFEIARGLNAPLDVFLVRKLGTPGQEELAMGAIATGGIRLLNDRVVNGLNISDEAIDQVAERERKELERRRREYRGDASPVDVEGKTVILVDDGLATGATMRAAVQALRRRDPARVIVAIGTAPPDTLKRLRSEVDEAVCIATPQPFYAVGGSYSDFSQTTDDEVRRLLAEAEDFGRQS